MDETESSPAPARATRALTAAGALAHPTRRRIADALAERPDGLTVSEVATVLGLHPNAVRLQLRTLASTGLVAIERLAPRGRGRPRLRYRLVDAQAATESAHRELVGLLVGYLAEIGADPGMVEEFGRRRGAQLAARDGVAAVVGAFARLGFAPNQMTSTAEAARGRLVLRLDHCPFRDAVMSTGGELVCTLHRGLAEGVARAASENGELTEFVAVDPQRAGCVLGFTGLTGEEAA